MNSTDELVRKWAAKWNCSPETAIRIINTYIASPIIFQLGVDQKITLPKAEEMIAAIPRN